MAPANATAGANRPARLAAWPSGEGAACRPIRWNFRFLLCVPACLKPLPNLGPHPATRPNRASRRACHLHVHLAKRQEKRKPLYGLKQGTNRQ